MFHQCSTLLISCIDFRFVTRTQQLLELWGLRDNYDHLAIPGSALYLARPLSAELGQFLLSQISISIEKHQARQIIIINHEDCGAYGGSRVFRSKNEEKTVHFKDLKKATMILQKRFKKILVKTFWLRFDGIDEM